MLRHSIVPLLIVSGAVLNLRVFGRPVGLAGPAAFTTRPFPFGVRPRPSLPAAAAASLGISPPASPSRRRCSRSTTCVAAAAAAILTARLPSEPFREALLLALLLTLLLHQAEKLTSNGKVVAWRAAHWANWHFEIDGYTSGGESGANSTILFGNGGFQGARGGPGSDWCK